MGDHQHAGNASGINHGIGSADLVHPGAREVVIRVRPVVGRLVLAQETGVRVLHAEPNQRRGVGELGRPRLPWKQESGGSNPSAPTISAVV